MLFACLLGNSPPVLPMATMLYTKKRKSNFSIVYPLDGGKTRWLCKCYGKVSCFTCAKLPENPLAHAQKPIGGWKRSSAQTL